MKERRQSNAKYKELSIQRETCTQVDGKIYRAIHDRESSIIECNKATITKFDENSSGNKRELDSIV